MKLFSVLRITAFLSALSAGIAHAQQTIPSGGGDASGSGGSASFTIGQLFYSEFSSTGNGTVSQGVQAVNLSIGNPLPVKLISFGGECLGGQVRLNWSTAAEVNNNLFHVEKSADAISWAVMATIKGAKTPAATNTYTYTDEHPDATVSYYRLQQMDVTGDATYSPTIYVVKCGEQQAAVTLYPNPASDGVYVNISAGVNSIAMSYELMTLNGKLVRKDVLPGGATYIPLSNLATASYFIKIRQGNTEIKTFKIFKN